MLMLPGKTHKARLRKAWLVVLYLLAFFLLLVQAKYYLSPLWGYVGFEWNPNSVKIVQSVLLISIFVLITPDDGSLRAFFLHVMLALYLVPSVSLYAGADKPEFALMVICIAFLIVYAVSALRVRRIVAARIDAMYLVWAVVVASLMMLLGYFYIGGTQNFNLDVSKVYDVRRDAADAMPGAFAFLWPLFSNILIPFSSVVAFVYRRYLVLAFFLVCGLLLYGFTSHKGIFFYPLLSITTYWALSKYQRCSMVSVVLVFALALGVVDIVCLLNSEDSAFFGWYSALLVRRAFMIPPFLDYSYLELFSGDASFYYWSSSRVTLGILSSPSALNAPNLVGEVYFGSAETSANTGFIGSGYAQAGLIGVVLYALGVGFVISLLQSFARHLGRPFVGAVMLGQVSTMITSTDFLVLFLTHGMLFSFLILSMLRSWQIGGKADGSVGLIAGDMPLGRRFYG